MKASSVHVKTRRGVVSLTGTVPSAADKQRAQEIVEGISGVRSVRNRLKVTEAGAHESCGADRNECDGTTCRALR